MENFHKDQPKSLKYHTFFFKTIRLMFTDINIYPINNKTDHISEKNIKKKKKSKTEVDIFSILGRIWSWIRIRYFTKRIRGSGSGSISKLTDSQHWFLARLGCRITFYCSGSGSCFVFFNRFRLRSPIIKRRNLILSLKNNLLVLSYDFSVYFKAKILLFSLRIVF